MSSAPAKNPCGSCPYRRDVPSGVWDESEYEKLPDYDRPTVEQPLATFGCHQQNGRLCAGWVGCHDMDESLSLKLAVGLGWISPEDARAAREYVSPVPLFESGAQAAEHGRAEIDDPSEKARKVIGKLTKKLPNLTTKGI